MKPWNFLKNLATRQVTTRDYWWAIGLICLFLAMSWVLANWGNPSVVFCNGQNTSIICYSMPNRHTDPVLSLGTAGVIEARLRPARYWIRATNCGIYSDGVGIAVAPTTTDGPQATARTFSLPNERTVAISCSEGGTVAIVKVWNS